MEQPTLEPLYDKKVQCPNCSNHFYTKKVRSKFVKPLRVERDFGPVFKEGDGNNPLYYYVTVCSDCGFSFTENFSALIPQDSRQKIRKEISEKMDKVTNFWNERNYEKAVRAYKLAIYSGTLSNQKHVVLANLCLRLAWLNRGVNKQEEERFLRLAASEYEQSYIHTDFNPESTPEVSILYLIGEINRRLGKYNEAVSYFLKVTQHPEHSRNMKFVNYAKEQWQLAVQEFRGQE